MQRWIGVEKIAKPFGGRHTPPEVLVAAVLRQVLQHASNITEGSLSALVTVPGCYDQMHRRAIRNACRIAGIELLQLIDKPLAAALSWLDVNCRLSSAMSGDAGLAPTKLLIVHLGGSGLEASVVQVNEMKARQLAVCGHWKLGTQRWQARLAEHFARALKEQTGKSIREDIAAATRLQRTVEMALNRLARAKKVDVKFDWLNGVIHQTITQAGFLRIATDLTSILQEMIIKACKEANTDLGEIDHLLLAGTLMHMQPLQECVRRLLPTRASVSNIDKAEFARGAAIQAKYVGAVFTKDPVNAFATGCTAYDIGLLAESQEAGTQTPHVVVEKTTAIPASLARTVRAKPVGTSQTLPTLQLIESSSLGDAHWLKLGRVKPSDLFPLRPFDDPLQLRMEIDENGILESSLLWQAGNRQARVPASSDPEMSDENIQSWKEWLATLMLCAEP
jgi:molecular chaperone DnaK (HSP70)